jgi:prepilin-type N-terminal cleavage/methylation domain-containing protein
VTRKRNSPGFTLIELIVAVALSTIVLIGVFSLMTNMVQTEVTSMRNGTVTVWSLASISAMNADIVGSSYLSYPSPGPGQDSLVTCTNWSPIAAAGGVAGPVNTAAGNTVYEYCYLPASNVLLRNVITNAVAACPGAAPACVVGLYSSGIVATGVYRDSAGDPVFTAQPTSTNANAVRLHFVIGNPAVGVSAGGNGTTSLAIPQSINYDTQIILED